MPDSRYEKLVSLWKPASQYPAYLSVVDIAGLVKGAAEGAGLGNAFLSHIQSVDALIHVVRAFESDEVVHVEDSVDPVRDLEAITHELCLKDLQYVDAAEALALRDVKKTPEMKLPLRFYSVMEKTRALLNANKPVRDGEWTGPEIETIREKLPSLITTKPIVSGGSQQLATRQPHSGDWMGRPYIVTVWYVMVFVIRILIILSYLSQVYMVNLSSADFIKKRNKHLAGIIEWVKGHGGGSVIPFSVEVRDAWWCV